MHHAALWQGGWWWIWNVHIQNRSLLRGTSINSPTHPIAWIKFLSAWKREIKWDFLYSVYSMSNLFFVCFTEMLSIEKNGWCSVSVNASPSQNCNQFYGLAFWDFSHLQGLLKPAVTIRTQDVSVYNHHHMYAKKVHTTSYLYRWHEEATRDGSPCSFTEMWDKKASQFWKENAHLTITEKLACNLCNVKGFVSCCAFTTFSGNIITHF